MPSTRVVLSRPRVAIANGSDSAKDKSSAICRGSSCDNMARSLPAGAWARTQCSTRPTRPGLASAVSECRTHTSGESSVGIVYGLQPPVGFYPNQTFGSRLTRRHGGGPCATPLRRGLGCRLGSGQPADMIACSGVLPAEHESRRRPRGHQSIGWSLRKSWT
jgi:hypothetical protein